MLVPEPRRQDTGRPYVSHPYPLGVHPSPERDGSANVAVYAPGIPDLDIVFRLPGGRWQRRRRILADRWRTPQQAGVRRHQRYDGPRRLRPPNLPR